MNIIKPNKPIFAEWSQYDTFDGYVAEPKLDGQRCFLLKRDGILKIIRHGGTVKNNQYPELMEIDLPDNTIVDGELCILESPYNANFTAMLHRETIDPLKIRILSKRNPATFVGFDILYHDDKDVSILPMFERRALLESIPQTDRFKAIVQTSPTDMLPMVESHNMEGIVLKSLNYDYSAKWIKFKNYIESDFKVVGFTSEQRMISALELADENGNIVGKVNYTGYPQSESFAKNLKGMTAVVRYMKTDKYLRFPVLKELRNV